MDYAIFYRWTSLYFDKDKKSSERFRLSIIEQILRYFNTALSIKFAILKSNGIEY